MTSRKAAALCASAGRDTGSGVIGGGGLLQLPMNSQYVQHDILIYGCTGPTPLYPCLPCTSILLYIVRMLSWTQTFWTAQVKDGLSFLVNIFFSASPVYFTCLVITFNRDLLSLFPLVDLVLPAAKPRAESAAIGRNSSRI